MQTTTEKEIVIKPCTHTGLAAAYGVSPKVLRSRMRPYQQLIGKRVGYRYSLEQLLIIMELLGLPHNSISGAKSNEPCGG